MRGMAIGILALAALTSPTRADPFYLRYDAEETYPEQDGFTRYGQDPEGLLVRSVKDGLFTIDSRASFGIFDLYLVQSDAFELERGEELRINWRMRTLEDTGTPQQTDVNFFLSNSSAAFVDLFIGPGFVSENELGDEHFYPFLPGFHTFSFRSADMLSYQLFVDGAFAFAGLFHAQAIIGPNFVTFGDAVIGERSLSKWDYVEIAVVPEPSTILCTSFLMFICHVGRRRGS
jgi:hypothetical protein